MSIRKVRIVVLVLMALLWILAFGQIASAADPKVEVIVHVAIAPTVSSSAATGVTSISALLHGSIDDDGNEPCSMRMFRWGLASGNYTYSWNETGSFTEGAFSHVIGSLPLGTQIFWMASANNTIGTGNSSERSFWTLSLPLAPTNFVATQTGINQVTLTWTMGLGAVNTTIRVQENDPPTSLTEGYEVYTGNGTSVNVTMAINENTIYGFSAWSENGYGLSLDYATTTIGGDVPLAFIALMLLPLGLTVTMFATKNSMLGFPSGIFWGVLGGYSYLQSTSTWDWQYLLFFASIGMVIFSILAAYTLRSRDLAGPDIDRGEQFIDEDKRRADDILWGENLGW